jgi:type II secretory pathway component PulK
VLESLAVGLNGEYSNPTVLASERKTGCFPDPQTLGNVAGGATAGIGNMTSQQSAYFQLTTRITLGTTEFTLYSLLFRSNGKVTVLLRSIGTP